MQWCHSWQRFIWCKWEWARLWAWDLCWGHWTIMHWGQFLVFAGSVLWTEKIHRTELNWTVVWSIFQLWLPKFGVILRSYQCPPYSCRIPVILVEWKLAGRPANFLILVFSHSSGIGLFQNLYWNGPWNGVPRNGQERNSTGIRSYIYYSL